MPLISKCHAPVLAALLVSQACGAEEVSIEGAWIRALPPTQPVTAAYMEIHNGGDTTRVVAGVSVEGAGRVEIHQTVDEGGLAAMRQLSGLTLPPGSSTTLAPGGTHLMLFELEAMPRDGERRRLCLQLESGPEACTQAQVRRSAAPADHHDHH